MKYKFESEIIKDEYGAEIVEYVRREFIEFFHPKITPQQGERVLLALKYQEASGEYRIRYIECCYDYNKCLIQYEPRGAYVSETERYRYLADANYIIGWAKLSDLDLCIKEIQK